MLSSIRFTCTRAKSTLRLLSSCIRTPRAVSLLPAPTSSPLLPFNASHRGISRTVFSRALSSSLPDHTVLRMPALSPTMTQVPLFANDSKLLFANNSKPTPMLQGNIAAWLKKIGDKISPGDAIAELETDKVHSFAITPAYNTAITQSQFIQRRHA